MREIEGIEKVVLQLKPHWDEIEAHFKVENARFKALLAQEHDALGRVLKCHLIVESYLNRFLLEKIGLEHLDDARLSFYQKAMLLPDAGSAVSAVKPGIIRLNRFRNQFAHSLNPNIEEEHLGAMDELLRVARPELVGAETIVRVEAFTTVACTWLIVPPPNLEALFVEAFRDLRAHVF